MLLIPIKSLMFSLSLKTWLKNALFCQTAYKMQDSTGKYS